MVYISSKLYMCNDLAGGNHQSLYACRKAAAQARQQDACALLASTAAPPVFHKAFLKLRWFKARKSTARLQQVPILVEASADVVSQRIAKNGVCASLLTYACWHCSCSCNSKNCSLGAVASLVQHASYRRMQLAVCHMVERRRAFASKHANRQICLV